tara:strand:- start:958 stop:3921 length:2964 start_codon:yes stop_codon:yes gene_type:complete
MATSVAQNTFLSVYNDDYRDSDHYHRILFNNGRALQARELTQVQTILQAEMARIATFLFKEGGVINTTFGSLNTGFQSARFMKVTTLPVGYATLVNTKITSSTGVTGYVLAIVPATGGDADTIVYKPGSADGQTNTAGTGAKDFEPSDVVSYESTTISGTVNIQTTNTTENPAVGDSSTVSMPRFETFVAGHMVLFQSQTLVISKYSATPTETVGFTVNESIISATDNIALYDNSGVTPNLTSPGADRYKITLTLTNESDISASDTFHALIQINQGRVTAVRTADNSLNEIGSYIATRVGDITGDYILNRSPEGRFQLSVENDSTDDNYLVYKVNGGIAYVGGNRSYIVENSNALRVQKPRNDPNDLDIYANQFVGARYGNFFLSNLDSCFGLVGGINTLASVNLYSAVDRGGSTLGTARIRNMDEYGNQYRLHAFEVNMDSTGTGIRYSTGDIRSIGTDAANYANLAPVEGVYGILDKQENSLLFPLQRTRVQEVSSVTMRTALVIAQTTNGSGQATFSTGSSNIWSDPEQWIVSVDSSGELFSSPTYTGTINTSVTVTGLPVSQAVKLLGYEAKTAVRKTKTLLTNQTAVVSIVNRAFKLAKADVYLFRSVVDNATNEDITYRFLFDNGQRDNFYSVGRGRLKTGSALPTSTVTVTYDYFTHNSGDFFAGKASYPDVVYKDVPTFTTALGQTYRLTDVIDMRPVKNAADTGFTSTGAVIEPLPRNTDIITIGTAKYWQPRSDLIYLNLEGIIDFKSGSTGTTFIAPDLPVGALPLHYINLNPYVISNKDLSTKSINNRGYQMSDIRRLENRIEDLEVLTALTLSELSARDVTVQDPTDPTLPDRVKRGITGDTFKYNNQSDIFSADYRAFINQMYGIVTPPVFFRTVGVTYDSDLSVGTIKKSNTIWPKYDEEVYISQAVASRAINVNQFDYGKAIGTAELNPSTDTWGVRKKVDAGYQADANSSTVQGQTIVIVSQGEFTVSGG